MRCDWSKRQVYRTVGVVVVAVVVLDHPDGGFEPFVFVLLDAFFDLVEKMPLVPSSNPYTSWQLDLILVQDHASITMVYRHRLYGHSPYLVQE